MRFSLLILMVGFVLFAIYLAWEQGAFSMKKFELRRQHADVALYSDDAKTVLNQGLQYSLPAPKTTSINIVSVAHERKEINLPLADKGQIADKQLSIGIA